MEEKTLKQDKELLAIQKEAGDIVNRAESFQLASDKSYEKATQVISWLAGVKKKIEERRKFFTQPLNDQVKKINELFKGYSNPINEARVIMDSKMLSYHREKQKKIDEENEKTRKEAERIAKKEDVPVGEVLASTEKKEVAKTVGTSTVKKKWTFKVVNESKVDRKYLIVNEVEVRADIRDGVRKMSGIEIFEEEIISTR